MQYNARLAVKVIISVTLETKKQQQQKGNAFCKAQHTFIYSIWSLKSTLLDMRLPYQAWHFSLTLLFVLSSRLRTKRRDTVDEELVPHFLIQETNK